MNLGLRWDTPLQFHELHNRSGIFDLNSGVYKQFGVNGFRTTTWPNDWNNFGPRAGFQLEFRGEIYNAHNRPIFGNPNTSVANANYGRITSASGQRNVQLGLKFYF